MRRHLALAALALAAGATVVPVTSASANCEITIDGHCYNLCTLLLGKYQAVREATGSKLLPNLECPQ